MSVSKRVRNGRTSWRVSWRVDGVIHEKNFKAERDAKRYDRDLDRGSYVDPNDQTSLSDFAAYYLSTRTHGESSRKVYAGYLHRINESGLGARPLGKIRPLEITGWVSRQQDAGLAPRTVALQVTFLRSVYAAAVADGRVAKSPVPRSSELRLATADSDDDIFVPSVEQVDLFADEMQRLDPRCRGLVIAQCGIGVRIGEAFALRKQDLDFDRHTVNVCGRVLVGTRVRVPGTKGSRGARVKSRVVPLLPDIAEELAEHMLLYPPRADGSLFTDASGRLYSHNAYAPRFVRARDQADLPTAVSSHTLRHHFASVALSKGVPVKDVATFLGHTDTRLVERIYGHVMGDAGARFLAAMGRTWGQRAPRVRHEVTSWPPA